MALTFKEKTLIESVYYEEMTLEEALDTVANLIKEAVDGAVMTKQEARNYLADNEVDVESGMEYVDGLEVYKKEDLDRFLNR